MKNMIRLLLVSAAVLALAACDVKVDSVGNPNLISSAPAMPDNLLGSWSANRTIGGYTTRFQMVLFDNGLGEIRANYSNDCGAGSEAFAGSVVSFDASTTPQRWSTKITAVTEFIGGCGNVLGLENTDVGRYVNCIGRKDSLTASSFEISCKLASAADDYPADYSSGDIYEVQ